MPSLMCYNIERERSVIDENEVLHMKLKKKPEHEPVVFFMLLEQSIFCMTKAKPTYENYRTLQGVWPKLQHRSI